MGRFEPPDPVRAMNQVKGTDNRAEIYVQEQSPGVFVVMGSGVGVKGKMPQRPFPVLRIDGLKSEADQFLAAGTRFTGFPEFIASRLRTKGWTCVSLEDMAKYLKA